MGLIYDTLRTSDKKRWCHKRIASFSAFWVSVFYMTIPLWRPSFQVETLIVTSLLAYSAAAIGIRLYEDKFQNEYGTNNLNNTTYDPTGDSNISGRS